jgi:hypothetical protein
MNKTMLSIIPANVKIAKLLTVLCIFTGFQAYAAPITTIGNLSYDGTLISGDGRIYVGLDTLAPLTYQQTLDKIANDPIYADYRVADNEDADYFINSLFGDTSDNCSTTDGVPQSDQICGKVNEWYDGAFGANSNEYYDLVWFLANESTTRETGYIQLYAPTALGDVYQGESYDSIENSDAFSEFGYMPYNVTWLLVTDSVASNAVPTPASFAIFVLGFAGIGFARRRRS